MTVRSPRELFKARPASVVGLAVGGDAQRRAIGDAAIGFVPALAATLEDGLALLESGLRAVVVAGPAAAIVLDLGGSSRAYADLRGWATLETMDAVDVDHARTIRRALADGGLKAVAIGYARIVVRDSSMTRERALSIFNRALGPYAADVPVDIVDEEDEELGPGDGPAVSDVLACVLAVARSTRPAAALLVRFSAPRTIALAFGMPR